ncbi:MAG: 3'(2'),5'-bisphosphate nucleotidase CysQ [Gemmatimonadetes bacterium]|nr:3'(2'),5'-bisphosphate nucleotidase CysQ [Gemmatimonadota bacterium]
MPTGADSLEGLVAGACEIATQAGRCILAFYRRAGAVEQKADASPLTQADRAAHELILQKLRRLTPEIPVLSEESSAEEIAGRHSWTRFWLVDPLDGTKEFLKQTGEFTVNLALIEEGAPVLGVVHVPVRSLTYHAAWGQGAYLWLPPEEPRRVRVRRADPARLVMVASRDHAGPRVRALLERLPGAQTLSMGSSLKFCLVAEGGADLYLRDLPTMEWDTAAAQCIVEEAGGEVTDLAGHRLRYNKPILQNPPILTVGDRKLDWKRYVRRD